MISASRLLTRSAFCLACTASLTGLAEATTLLDTSIQIGANTPMQLGRLSRSGVPSDWSSSKVFPGVINTTTPYHYATFDLDIAALESGYSYSPYLQITFDSTSATTFLSAYLGAYDPTNLATHYLGDEGSSGNAFGTDPSTFQLVVPSSPHLILVLNESSTNGGLNMPGGLLIEAFADTEYTDLAVAAPVPEPATWAFLAGGLALLGGMGRRRARRAEAAPIVAAH